MVKKEGEGGEGVLKEERREKREREEKGGGERRRRGRRGIGLRERLRIWAGPR